MSSPNLYIDFFLREQVTEDMIRKFYNMVKPIGFKFEYGGKDTGLCHLISTEDIIQANFDDVVKMMVEKKIYSMNLSHGKDDDFESSLSFRSIENNVTNIGLSVEGFHFSCSDGDEEKTRKNVELTIKFVKAVIEGMNPFFVYACSENHLPENYEKTMHAEIAEKGYVNRLFWINYFSAERIKKLGIEKINEMKAFRKIKLSNGGMLIVLTDNPLYNTKRYPDYYNLSVFPIEKILKWPMTMKIYYNREKPSKDEWESKNKRSIEFYKDNLLTIDSSDKKKIMHIKRKIKELENQEYPYEGM